MTFRKIYNTQPPEIRMIEVYSYAKHIVSMNIDKLPLVYIVSIAVTINIPKNLTWKEYEY